MEPIASIVKDYGDTRRLACSEEQKGDSTALCFASLADIQTSEQSSTSSVGSEIVKSKQIETINERHQEDICQYLQIGYSLDQIAAISGMPSLSLILLKKNTSRLFRRKINDALYTYWELELLRAYESLKAELPALSGQLALTQRRAWFGAAEKMRDRFLVEKLASEEVDRKRREAKQERLLEGKELEAEEDEPEVDIHSVQVVNYASLPKKEDNL